LPSTESYFSRCASVLAFVRSLTATKSISLSPSAARRMFRFSIVYLALLFAALLIDHYLL